MPDIKNDDQLLEYINPRGEDAFFLDGSKRSFLERTGGRLVDSFKRMANATAIGRDVVSFLEGREKEPLTPEQKEQQLLDLAMNYGSGGLAGITRSKAVTNTLKQVFGLKKPSDVAIGLDYVLGLLQAPKKTLNLFSDVGLNEGAFAARVQPRPGLDYSYYPIRLNKSSPTGYGGTQLQGSDLPILELNPNKTAFNEAFATLGHEFTHGHQWVTEDMAPILRELLQMRKHLQQGYKTGQLNYTKFYKLDPTEEHARTVEKAIKRTNSFNPLGKTFEDTLMSSARKGYDWLAEHYSPDYMERHFPQFVDWMNLNPVK